MVYFDFMGAKSDISRKKRALWEFLDSDGTFRVNRTDVWNRLYFPLANENGMLANITPDLKGSIKTGHHSFLTLPVSTDDLHNIKSSRNFWICTDRKKIWSVTGVSSNRFEHKEKTSLRAGLLWHELTRYNETLGLEAQITNFIPASGERVEIMEVKITNRSRQRQKIVATFAVPIFGRSADRLRDHRHVSSLLHRVRLHRYGILVTPTMSFDERGHRMNALTYAVLGQDDHARAPVRFFPTVEGFIGEGGNLERPAAVFQDVPPASENGIQGKEVMGAFRFRERELRPSSCCSFTVLLGIAEKTSEIEQWLKRFDRKEKIVRSLESTTAYWAGKSGQIIIRTHDHLYDGWLKWVSTQPVLRNIFGNSFLPDFDYGRGGRGWRDIWQDCLGLLLTHPEETKRILLHNFAGIRIDGSNATVITWPEHEFIADRNNISRVWMDHGAWPFLTTELYVHQTGDLGFLLRKTSYFRDHQLSRSKETDFSWNESYGKKLKTKTRKIYTGTLIEHILVEHLVPFFNVGPHNYIRLENADWNDGMDMAAERGESVAFTSLYAGNMKRLADLLEALAAKQSLSDVVLAQELDILLDARKGDRGKASQRYRSLAYKTGVLKRYLKSVEPEISGKTIRIPLDEIIRDLRAKAAFFFDHIRNNEWIKTKSGHGFFNGYYDNKARRVEGDHPLGVRMTLTGQVFPIMTGVAEDPQVREIVRSVNRYLRDERLGGIRLNTDFRQIQPDLGRAFSFAYGDKENGAFFSHMAVMYANALYQRGLADEGFRVLRTLFEMSTDTEKSQIYPGLPEYFNSDGRGLYHYLTGSASWYLLTLFTQSLGIRGSFGDLVIEPKLVKDQFKSSDVLSAEFNFAGRRIHLDYSNPQRLSYERYRIARATLNGDPLPRSQTSITIPLRLLAKLPKTKTHSLHVLLR